jgi:hypothetical protein
VLEQVHETSTSLVSARADVLNEDRKRPAQRDPRCDPRNPFFNFVSLNFTVGTVTAAIDERRAS